MDGYPRDYDRFDPVNLFLDREADNAFGEASAASAGYNAKESPMPTTQQVTTGEIGTEDLRPIGVYFAFIQEDKGVMFPVTIGVFDGGDGTHVLEFKHTSSLFHEPTRKWIERHHSTSAIAIADPIDLGRLNTIAYELMVEAGAIPTKQEEAT